MVILFGWFLWIWKNMLFKCLFFFACLPLKVVRTGVQLILNVRVFICPAHGTKWCSNLSAISWNYPAYPVTVTTMIIQFHVWFIWDWNRGWEGFTQDIHPRKLTWNLRMMVFHRNLLFEGFIFRFHVSFRGSKYLIKLQSSNMFFFHMPSGVHVLFRWRILRFLNLPGWRKSLKSNGFHQFLGRTTALKGWTEELKPPHICR